jgi:hypothetical protein
MHTATREGWMRLPKNDRRQHFFREGMSECGRYVTAFSKFDDSERPGVRTCPSCLIGAAKAPR